MKIIDIDTMKPPGGEVATFQGAEHGADVSFFIVQFSPGQGPKKHRHPYDETCIILDGEIEAIVAGKTHRIGSGTVVIIPPRSWHEFKAVSATPVSMINIHSASIMITEWT